MKPHGYVRAEGHLERTFSLTNVGKYLISARGRFRSTNWSGNPPGEWIELVTPPVEIEILPSTNVSTVKPKLAGKTEPAAVNATSEPKNATASQADAPSPDTGTGQATAEDNPLEQSPPPSKRNQIFVLLLGGILLFGFIVLIFRRKKS